MAVEYVDRGGTDGACFGKSSTEKIAFYGTTPVVQPSANTDVTTSVTTSATTTNLASTVSDIVTLVNAINGNLQTLGLTAS